MSVCLVISVAITYLHDYIYGVLLVTVSVLRVVWSSHLSSGVLRVRDASDKEHEQATPHVQILKFDAWICINTQYAVDI